MVNGSTSTLKQWEAPKLGAHQERRSELCKAADFKTDWYARWCREINETPRFHRKQWEYVYILQALSERGCLKPGNKGLAFAVGSEPLPAVFVKYGCSVLATDINPALGEKLGWSSGNQLCYGIESLNQRGIVPDALFREHVNYRPVDMNNIPEDVVDFDFNWSSCSFEHLGSISKGLRFLKNQMATLKPGGWAVHTTEYNISSEEFTIEKDPNTVIFRKKDLEQVVAELEEEGHFVEKLDFSLGNQPEDFYVDQPPYGPEPHLRLMLDGYVATSIGLIIRKGGHAKKRKSSFSFFSRK